MMKPQFKLTAGEREFLVRVTRLTYTNPFGEVRGRLLGDLLQSPPENTPEGHSAADPQALSQVLTATLARFDRGAPARIEHFPAKDRPLLESAFLYLTYHHFLDDLDRLIADQLNSEKPVAVAFHTEYFAAAAERGISEERAVLYLGFFFQLRRAFHFIHQSLVGESLPMRSLRYSLWNNVFTHDMQRYATRMWHRMEDFSTLLLGETGTGKGSAAAAIGRSSFIPYSLKTHCFTASFTRTFVALNISQFPETLIESELFGHRKGAFTGAVENYDGALALCHRHGALFLDEIGEVSVPIQIKLLQVLQERKFSPLGGHESKRFQGRVIAATNQSLHELQAGGRFRDDFFYRLCSDVIVVPALRDRIRDRPEELSELVAVVMQRMTGEQDSVAVDKTVAVLRKDLPRDYGWPGNVRELEQAVRRILLTGRYSGREAAQPRDREECFVESARQGRLSADELIGRYCAMLYERNPVYSDVAAATELDRRTVRKHVLRFSRLT